jgi:hypothetical protein
MTAEQKTNVRAQTSQGSERKLQHGGGSGDDDAEYDEFDGSLSAATAFVLRPSPPR